VCKKLIKNSQPFGKKFQKTVGGIFLIILYTSPASQMLGVTKNNFFNRAVDLTR